MKFKNSNASELNNNSDASTLAHETRKNLKPKRSFFGVLCSLLLLALFVGISACGDDDDDGDNGGGNGGVLTITHLSEYNDKYVWVSGSESTDGYVYFEKFTGGDVKISNGEAKVPMFFFRTRNDLFLNKEEPYKGNDKSQDLNIYIGAGESDNKHVGTVRVDFTDGNATVDWRDRLLYFEVREGRPQGYLTVTGLADYDGMYIGARLYFDDEEKNNRFSGFEKFGLIEDVGYRWSYVKISGGYAKIPLVETFTKDGSYDFFLPYTGSDKEVEVYLSGYSDVHGPGGSRICSAIVDFTDGNGTVDCREW